MLHREDVGISQYQPGLFTAYGSSQPSMTPIEPAEPPPQMPAKRSSITYILNDEPGEPQLPQKRFVSEQSSSTRGPINIPSARPNDPGTRTSLESPAPYDQGASLVSASHQKTTLLHYQPSSDHLWYPSAIGTPGPPSNCNCMACFESSPQHQHLLPQQPALQHIICHSRTGKVVQNSSYMSTQAQPGFLEMAPQAGQYQRILNQQTENYHRTRNSIRRQQGMKCRRRHIPGPAGEPSGTIAGSSTTEGALQASGSSTTPTELASAHARPLC
jgi:hypothetical protein